MEVAALIGAARVSKRFPNGTKSPGHGTSSFYRPAPATPGAAATKAAVFNRFT